MNHLRRLLTSTYLSNFDLSPHAAPLISSPSVTPSQERILSRHESKIKAAPLKRLAKNMRVESAEDQAHSLAALNEQLAHVAADIRAEALSYVVDQLGITINDPINQTKVMQLIQTHFPYSSRNAAARFYGGIIVQDLAKAIRYGKLNPALRTPCQLFIEQQSWALLSCDSERNGVYLSLRSGSGAHIAENTAI